MERYLRGCRGARRTRVRVVREPDEFLSLEDERRFHEEEGNDSNNENSASEVIETDGIPDSAFISGIAVERLKLPVWYSKFYESLLYPPTELKLSANCVVGRCKICVSENRERTFNRASLGSLSNLQRHLKRNHNVEWEEWKNSRVVSVAQPPPGQVSLSYVNKNPMGKTRQEELKAALATMIVIDNMPPTSVLKPGLRHFVQVMPSTYNCCS